MSSWFKNASRLSGVPFDDFVANFHHHEQRRCPGRKTSLESDHHQATLWMNGHKHDYRKVVSIAKAFGISTFELQTCYPPIRPPRHVSAADNAAAPTPAAVTPRRPRPYPIAAHCKPVPEGSFAALLRQWQTDIGLENLAAAGVCLLDASEWSRYRTGHTIPTLTKMAAIAFGTDLDPVILATACAVAPGVPDTYIDQVRRSCTGVAAMARLWVHQHNASGADLASLCNVSPGAMSALLKGRRDPAVLLAFAKALNVPGHSVLELAGFEPTEADHIARSFTAAAKRTSAPASFGQLVYDARTRNGWTQRQAASRLGHSDRAEVSRFENGHKVPSYKSVTNACSALGIPLRDALRACGFAEHLRAA